MFRFWRRPAASVVPVIIGFKTAPIGAEPEFQPAARLVSEAAKAKSVATQRQAFQTARYKMPYVCRVTAVALSHGSLSDPYALRDYSFSGPTVSLSVSRHLQMFFAKEWLPSGRDTVEPCGLVRFYGFDVGTFLSLMGFECAEGGQPCPADLWKSPLRRCSIESLVLPGGVGRVIGLCDALRRLRVEVSDSFAPGNSVEDDVDIAKKVLSGMGVLR